MSSAGVAGSKDLRHANKGRHFFVMADSETVGAGGRQGGGSADEGAGVREGMGQAAGEGKRRAVMRNGRDEDDGDGPAGG